MGDDESGSRRGFRCERPPATYWVTGGGSCVSEETNDEIGAEELPPITSAARQKTLGLALWWADQGDSSLVEVDIGVAGGGNL